MLSFDHPNVMCLIGVCIDGEMPLLIMPFMSNGSTLDYIRHHKSELCVSYFSTFYVNPLLFTIIDPNSHKNSSWHMSSDLKRNGVPLTTQVCSS